MTVDNKALAQRPTQRLTQKPPKDYVIGHYLQPAMEAYLARGGRVSALADTMGVSDAWLLWPPQRVMIADYFKLLLAASEITQDPCFGLRLGQHSSLENFDQLGKALVEGNNLADALQQVMILERLTHRLGQSSVTEEGEHIRLIWRCRYQGHTAVRHVSESILVSIIHLAQQLTGRVVPVLEMTFVHPKSMSVSAADYRQFCQGQCYFSRPYNSLLVSKSVLAWPLAGVSHRAGVALSQQHSTLKRLKQQLLSHLVNSPKLDTMACLLGMSPRRLQRQLEQQGQSFQQVLSEVRLQQSQDYLTYSTLSPMQISQLLGFSEQSSFNHFFKQCTGKSPSRYRQSLGVDRG